MLEGKEKTMTVALAPDTDGLGRIPGFPVKPALLQASSFLADLAKPRVPGPHGYFDDLEEADGWARRFYGTWVEGYPRRSTRRSTSTKGRAFAA